MEGAGMFRLGFLLTIVLVLMGCNEKDDSYNGYIDADLIYLSANFSGRLTDLAVLRGQSIQKDQFLFKLEQTSEQYGVEMSQLSDKSLLAQRAQILSKIHYGEINYARVLKMRSHEAASQNDLDVAKNDLSVLKEKLAEIDAQIKSSEVNVADNQWRMQRKESFSPDEGIVFDTYYNKGEFVQAGQPVLALITSQHIKVVFFVPETELAKIKLDEKIKVSADGNPKLAVGKIFYISNIAEYTPPIIYSREERQRLVFRVEANVISPQLKALHLGQPVTLELVT